jgi:hypothetical protein
MVKQVYWSAGVLQKKEICRRAKSNTPILHHVIVLKKYKKF